MNPHVKHTKTSTEYLRWFVYINNMLQMVTENIPLTMLGYNNFYLITFNL